MWIELNGEQTETNSANLNVLCKEFEFDPKIVATALNGEFVPRDQRTHTILNDGDQVEVFAPQQGG